MNAFGDVTVQAMQQGVNTMKVIKGIVGITLQTTSLREMVILGTRVGIGHMVCQKLVLVELHFCKLYGTNI